MKKKIFKQHYSGLWVARDGEVFVPKSGNYPEHYTYGRKRKDGYRQVKYKGQGYLVHRLVAETYILNNDGKPYIDHINTNRSDNRVENLRWSTREENNNNPITRQHLSEANKGENNPMYGKHHSEETKQKIAKAKKIPIIGTHKKTGVTVEFDSATDAWLTLNIGKSNIIACCKGIRKSTGGYVWRYA